MLALEADVDEVVVGEDEGLVVLVLQVVQDLVVGKAALPEPGHHALLPACIIHLACSISHLLVKVALSY